MNAIHSFIQHTHADPLHCAWPCASDRDAGVPTQELWGKPSTPDGASEKGLDGWVGICQVREGSPSRGSHSAKTKRPPRGDGNAEGMWGRVERPGQPSAVSLAAPSGHFCHFHQSLDRACPGKQSPFLGRAKVELVGRQKAAGGQRTQGLQGWHPGWLWSL